MEYPHLSNAPIREAIIDIRVKHVPTLKVSDFRSLEKQLSSEFPIMDDRKARSLGVRFGPDKTDVIEDSDELDAIVFKTEDQKEILQLTKTGFTFNRLEPYTNWEDIIEKAKKAWDLYQEVSSPLFITRIATRYINNIILPLNTNLEEYLANAPKVPSDGPNFFTNSLGRITLVEPDQDLFVHLTQTVETKENDIAIIIDIDAFKNKQLDFENGNPWNDFEELREMKNRLFFSSLTDKSINIYK